MILEVVITIIMILKVIITITMILEVIIIRQLQKCSGEGGIGHNNEQGGQPKVDKNYF